MHYRLRLFLLPELFPAHSDAVESVPGPVFYLPVKKGQHGLLIPVA
jgi:hypothetical protein